MKKLAHFIIAFMLWQSANVGYAHEPIYGLGPETLPKYMNALEFGTRFSARAGTFQYEFGYGLGITQNWTVRLDAPAINNGSTYGLGDLRLRTKYVLWRKTAPGVLKRLTAIAVLRLPTTNENLGFNGATAMTLGIANGYESRRWYYFSDIGYTYFKSATDTQTASRFRYNLVGGIRPIKTGYLKPDLVLLIELNGELSGKMRIDGNKQQKTGGNTLAVAPGFLLSYRNLMLKAGAQFGIAKTKNVNKIATNGLISLEYHF